MKLEVGVHLAFGRGQRSRRASPVAFGDEKSDSLVRPNRAEQYHLIANMLIALAPFACLLAIAQREVQTDQDPGNGYAQFR